jgi:hypothetical protein
MGNPTDQKITGLNADDLARLDAQRGAVTAFLADERSRASFEKETSAKLALLQTLLDAEVFSAEQTYELQCMGIVLGDAFVADVGMEWIMVEDEWGRDPALRAPGTSIIMYPLTMISKRVEQGDRFMVADLFGAMAESVRKLIEDGVDPA